MAEMNLIGTYNYVYGAGNTANRQIDFLGDGNNVCGIVKGKVKGSWQNIGEISETAMSKEGASTKEKVRIMMTARETGQRVIYPPRKSFDQIPYQEKVDIINNLQPTGNYRIEIANNIGDNPFFEKVERLNFFDPT